MAGDLHLLDASCVTAAGRGVAAALGALDARMQLGVRHPTIELPGRDGSAEPVTYVPALAEPGEDRVEDLLLTLLEDLPASAELVWVARAHAAGGQPGADAELAGRVQEALGIPCEVLDASGGIAPILAGASNRLQQHDAGSAWLVAADSGADIPELLTLERSAGVQRQTVDGQLPGEAAIALQLARTPPGDRSVPTIKAAAPPAQDGVGNASAALAAGIRAALQGAGLRADAVGAIFTDGPADLDDVLAWSNCMNELWPSRPSPEQLHAMELGMIEPLAPAAAHPPHHQSARVLGNLGCAGLPLQIALAASWQRRQARWSVLGLADAPRPALACEQYGGGCNAVVVDGLDNQGATRCT